jgi:IS5 family transposase
LPFRQTKEGIARGHAKGKVPSIPDYTTISRRINRLDIKIENDDKYKEFKDEYIVIAIDSTEIKITNRGQWMRDKWNVKKERYLKIHIVAVNVKNKKILSIKVTADERVHDSKVLLDLVNDIVKSNKIIGKLYHLAYVPELYGLFFSIF